MTDTTIPQTTNANAMEAIAEIVRKHNCEIIDYMDNQIRFRSTRETALVISVECRYELTDYQLTDVSEHWHFNDGKWEMPYWLMIFNLPESSE